MKKIYRSLVAVMVSLSVFGTAAFAIGGTYEHSDFIEKEQPELTEETKQLIAAYRNEPNEDNYIALRNIVIENYNEVLAKKEAKLAELRDETEGLPGGDDIVAEMEEIVQEMYITYWSRINSSMLRFTDNRLLRWKISEAASYEYIPVMGAGESIYIKRTPVTNAEYKIYITQTGTAAPSNWTDGAYADGEDSYPVNFVSYEDALGYCAWLTQEDGANTYRLPNESEWELAAGHMPKDADFNCNIVDGRVSVLEYADVTRGAHGAVDFWGNVWEWTSTVRSEYDGITMLGVKGGSWKSPRTECRTEYRKGARAASGVYDDVGFRVIQVKNGIEPEQKVELAALDSPTVTATSPAPGTAALSWNGIEGANEYQIFEYDKSTGLVSMMPTVTDTSVTIDGLEQGRTYSYIVQPISFTLIADNVYPEYSVDVAIQQDGTTPVAEPTVISAIYDRDGALIGVRTYKNKEQASYAGDMAAELAGAEVIKMYVWDMKSLTPLDAVTAKTVTDGKSDTASLLYQGHASFRLTLDNGKIVYIDPYAGEGYDVPADLILVTHEHPDHNAVDIMPHAEDCVIFRSADAIKDGKYQELDIYGIHVEPVQAYNKNHDVSKCVGYLVTVNDKLLYFAGDTSKTDQMSELAERHIDFAFLPMDGKYNMDIPEAIECAELIQAKHTVPIHTGLGGLYSESRAQQFVTPSVMLVYPGSSIEL